MQKLEFIAKRVFVDGSHDWAGFLRHRAAAGQSRPAIKATAERAAIARFKVKGLKGAPRYAGALTATTGMPTNIKARVSHNGHRCLHKTIKSSENSISAHPAKVTARISRDAGVPIRLSRSSSIAS